MNLTSKNSNMLKIEFVQGDMFADSGDMTDGLAFFGKNNMAFGLGASLSRIALPEGISDPFEIPFKPIPLGDGRALFCIPGEFMSDDDLRQAIARLFGIASEMGLTSLSMNGVRNSEKLRAESTAQAKQMDDGGRIAETGSEVRRGEAMHLLLPGTMRGVRTLGLKKQFPSSRWG